MSNPTRRRDLQAVDADLGVSTSLSSNVRGRSEMVRMVDDIQRHTNTAMNASAPETILGKVIDMIAPSAARQEQKRRDAELLGIEVGAQISIHRHVKDAQVRQIAAFSEAYGTAAELEAANEIAARGIEVAGRIDAEIERTGEKFDQAIDEAVVQASALQSSSARFSASERLKRRIEMRGEIEDLAMDGVRGALRRTRPRE